jgi:hypothetical protein
VSLAPGYCAHLTCKIERLVGSDHIGVLRVCGHIQAEHLSTIEELVASENSRVVLDLGEVTLVDRDAVRYLAGCELRGIALRNCPLFVREWLTNEQLP